jgi:hypothetical protein
MATTFEDAMAWGSKMNGAGNSTIIRVELSTDSLGQMFQMSSLDGIGPAVYGELEQLQNAVLKVLSP